MRSLTLSTLHVVLHQLPPNRTISTLEIIDKASNSISRVITSTPHILLAILLLTKILFF
uniref:Uncharacterized protein n=1 Tax=Rhizophora mucronata TaxID=61149 RepID=A0A2P2QX51_RHIMU